MVIQLWRKSCWTANENVVEASLALVRAELHTVTQSFEAVSESANGKAKRHEEELEELLTRNEIVLLEAARALKKTQSTKQAQLDVARATLCTAQVSVTASAAVALAAADIGSRQMAALEQACWTLQLP